jgi:hypothetical protein
LKRIFCDTAVKVAEDEIEAMLSLLNEKEHEGSDCHAFALAHTFKLIYLA